MKKTFIVTINGNGVNMVKGIKTDNKKKAKRIVCHQVLLQWSTPSLFNMNPSFKMTNNAFKTLKSKGFKIDAHLLEDVMM